jgi:hypothetical protein
MGYTVHFTVASVVSISFHLLTRQPSTVLCVPSHPTATPLLHTSSTTPLHNKNSQQHQPIDPSPSDTQIQATTLRSDSNPRYSQSHPTPHNYHTHLFLPENLPSSLSTCAYLQYIFYQHPPPTSYERSCNDNNAVQQRHNPHRCACRGLCCGVLVVAV